MDRPPVAAVAVDTPAVPQPAGAVSTATPVPGPLPSAARPGGSGTDPL